MVFLSVFRTGLYYKDKFRSLNAKNSVNHTEISVAYAWGVLLP